MSENRTFRCLVSGRVQGVWFRGHTQKAARALGLVGWVRNLPDGRVECLARGPMDALAAFRERIAQGPPLAKVTELTCTDLPQEETLDETPDEPYTDFTILR